MSTPFRQDRPGQYLLQVRLTPNARQERIEGPQILADGRTVLAVRVRAVPEDGAANAALCALVARALDIPKSRVSVAAGQTQRLKTLRIDSESANVAAVLAQLSEA